MRIYGLIGYPLGHSFSQQYFTEKFAREGIADARYELFPLENIAGLPALLDQNPDLRGLNVTIPHKGSVVPLLQALDETARAVGAVNCIKIEEGRLIGFNTDVIGFEKSLMNFFGEAPPAPPDGGESVALLAIRKESGKKTGSEGALPPEVSPPRPPQRGESVVFGNTDRETGSEAPLPPLGGSGGALILGTGGAAKAVAYVLKKLGIPYLFVSRSPAGKDQISYETVHRLPSTAYCLVVNTTPLGMSPTTDTCPDLPFERLTSKHLAFDLVYNPAETLFLRRAKKQGCAVKNGLEMLHLQAEASWEIWQQDIDLTNRIFNDEIFKGNLEQ